MIIRKNCVICDSSIFEDIYTFYDFPTYMGSCTNDEKIKSHDMCWVECKNCGCVQLKFLANLNDVYKQNHNSAIGETWKQHHTYFSSLVISTIRNIPNCSLLEIGGANLYLANLVCEKNSNVEYDIVDIQDSDKLYFYKNINLHKSDFSNFSVLKKYNIVIHSHTFEHSYNPIDFLKSINDRLYDDGIMIMSIPNIENQIKNFHLNALHFEHTFYYNDFLIDNLLNKSGFQIIENIDYSPWNKIYVCKKNHHKSTNNKQLFYDSSIKNTYNNFITHIKNDIQVTNDKLSNTKFFVYGAHINAIYMINCGLNKKNIIGILDNDKSKIKKYLSNTNIKTFSPEVIKNKINPTVLLRMSQYNQEIIKQLKLLNMNTIIV